MTRKILTELAEAIRARRPFNAGNTTYSPADGTVRLHGNLIARGLHIGAPQFSLAGWNTPTTRGRISAVAQAVGRAITVHNVKGVAHANGVPIVDEICWF